MQNVNETNSPDLDNLDLIPSAMPETNPNKQADDGVTWDSRQDALLMNAARRLVSEEY
jgi:hypothetical protein